MRRILLAPVTVSPTKPLTPSHVKFQLAVDVLRRATATYAEVTHLCRPLAHAVSPQVAGFWEYLDRRHPGLSADRLDETGIGDLYGEFQRAERAPWPLLRPVVRRARAGWVHPVSLRLLEVWAGHHRTLGLPGPDPARAGGDGEMPADELVELLVRHDVAIDGRPIGAPVFLDATARGLPLRVVIGPEGRANYLLSTLCAIVPRLAAHDHVVLVHDPELRSDYRTIAHVLTRLDAEVSRLELPRVPLGGVVRSARHGDWHGHTVDEITAPLAAGFDGDAVALGLRLYLIAGLGRTAGASFSGRHLRRWVVRAERILAADPVAVPPLEPLAGPMPWTDPFRVVAALLGDRPDLPASALAAVVLGRTSAPARLPVAAA